jgi:transposase
MGMNVRIRRLHDAHLACAMTTHTRLTPCNKMIRYKLKKMLYELGTKGNNGKKVGQQTRKVMYGGEDRVGAK